MKPITVTFQDTWETDYQSLDYEVTGTVIPGRPAKVNGPPEKCYPEDPAMFDGWDVKLTGIGRAIEPDLTILDIDEAEKAAIEIGIISHLQENLFELAERAFEVANEICQAAQERDWP